METETPLHQALIKPVVLLGAPRGLTIINIVFSLCMFMSFKAWWVIVFTVVTQSIGVCMVKNDPDFMEVLLRHLKHQDFYDV